MTEKPDDDSSSIREDWANHAHTQAIREALQKAAGKAMDGLKAACMNTTDPKIMEAYVKWRETAVYAEVFRTGGSK